MSQLDHKHLDKDVPYFKEHVRYRFEFNEAITSEKYTHTLKLAVSCRPTESG